MSSREPSGFASQPEPPGSRYTPEETIRFQEMFLPQSELYRRRQRHGVIACLAGSAPYLGYLLLSGLARLLLDRPLLPSVLQIPLGILCVISVVIGIGMLWSLPALKCPACHIRLDEEILRHCPECGSDHLERYRGNHVECQACHKTLQTDSNETRRYRIHACTGCGVMLDYHGL